MISERGLRFKVIVLCFSFKLISGLCSWLSPAQHRLSFCISSSHCLLTAWSHNFLFFFFLVDGTAEGLCAKICLIFPRLVSGGWQCWIFFCFFRFWTTRTKRSIWGSRENSFMPICVFLLWIITRESFHENVSTSLRWWHISICFLRSIDTI